MTQHYPNRLIVDVEGTSATLEKAFGVTINNYELRGSTEFSNDRDPVIPANLANVIQSIGGLNSVQRAHALHDGNSAQLFKSYAEGDVASAGASGQHDGNLEAFQEALKASDAKRGMSSGLKGARRMGLSISTSPAVSSIRRISLAATATPMARCRTSAIAAIRPMPAAALPRQPRLPSPPPLASRVAISPVSEPLQLPRLSLVRDQRRWHPVLLQRRNHARYRMVDRHGQQLRLFHRHFFGLCLSRRQQPALNLHRCLQRHPEPK